VCSSAFLLSAFESSVLCAVLVEMEVGFVVVVVVVS